MDTFLKQYGERRTGTNYLRALLFSNCAGVIPLMHILGDKHSAPVDLDECWQKASGLPDVAWEFVRTATFASPAESTRADDAEQLAHMRNMAESLANSVASGQLGFLISVKHPYAWAASFARYSGWMITIDDELRMQIGLQSALELACGQFNERHRAWLDHWSRFPSRTAIVKYEDLLSDTAMVLSMLVAKFGLQRSTDECALITGTVGAVDWDNCPLLISEHPFDTSFYYERRFVDQLSPELWEVVRRTIDWGIAREFGYAPDT